MLSLGVVMLHVASLDGGRVILIHLHNAYGYPLVICVVRRDSQPCDEKTEGNYRGKKVCVVLGAKWKSIPTMRYVMTTVDARKWKFKTIEFVAF